MTLVSAVNSSPSLRADRFILPLRWYGRSVTNVFTKPLSKERTGLEVLARLVTSIALLALSLSLFFSVPMALIGLGIKYYLRSKQAENSIPTPIEQNEICFQVENICNRIEEIKNKATLNQKGGLLLKDLLEFKQNYSKYQKYEGLGTVFATIEEAEATFLALSRLYGDYQEILEQYFMSLNADNNGIIHQPKDGNCWLHVALFALKELKIAPIELDHETLRSNVVSWMIENREDVQLKECLDGNPEKGIDSSIQTHKGTKIRNLQAELSNWKSAFDQGIISKRELEQVSEPLLEQLAKLENFNEEAYFEDMKAVGTHGSRAELYAISKLYGVNIKIWRNTGNKLSDEFDCSISDEENRYTIDILMSKEGNHYDALAPRVV